MISCSRMLNRLGWDGIGLFCCGLGFSAGPSLLLLLRLVKGVNAWALWRLASLKHSVFGIALDYIMAFLLATTYLLLLLPLFSDTNRIGNFWYL